MYSVLYIIVVNLNPVNEHRMSSCNADSPVSVGDAILVFII